jgi:hypothetical protein
MVHDGNPHAGNNKNALRGTLVGNWVEERALEADTGIFRYEVRRGSIALASRRRRVGRRPRQEGSQRIR